MAITVRRLNMKDLSCNAMQRGAVILVMTKEEMIAGVTMAIYMVRGRTTTTVEGALRVLPTALAIVMA
jgi:aerobic-type carbon monoxide dehydrogenase small subunit (CoxS/CutS family)